ncbi:hypothetical protein ACTNDG_00880 [Clostridium sp. HCP1S3_B4]|uniref:hypothetical protein n=1 Tax=unclassified Clostridium TaxID=2614128 RepID=UPI003F8A7BBF
MKKRMKKINCIIYGLSTARQSIEENLRDSINIIGYSDSFKKLSQYNLKNFMYQKNF